MSNMKFAGKTPICVNGKCHRFYSLKKMDEVQTALAHETGLCPVCQAKAGILAQFKPVTTEAEVKAAMNEVAATKETTSTKVASVKPAKQIKEILTSLVENDMINDAMLENLLDKQYTLKSLGGIKYPFLKEVDTSMAISDQVKINGKARYSTNVMNICGKDVVMTNDIYQKHLTIFQNWAKQFDLKEAV